MKKTLLILSIFIILAPANLNSQAHYEVERAKFSSTKCDEFCPVLHMDQIVFCSNQEYELFITHKNKKNKGLFSIFKVNIDPEADQLDPEVFSTNLLTPFNDGPVAFSPDGKLMVYSRNMDIQAKVKNIFDLGNNLGLYFAELKDGEWLPISDFPFNNQDYSITTPCFSPDGQYLYFGSDMPGGYGGADLYRSEQVDGEWNEPENLGSTINTKGNEVYPYIAENGDLFFASDGHAGLGKKDIFISRFSEMGWITPVHLESPINSKDDDFGLITNPDFSEGYFSSSRGKTDDIYRFSTLLPQLFDCDTLLENQYCFEFWDEQYPGMDSLPVIYEWEFSDGTKKTGLQVDHCLPGAGKYWAKLNIIDNTTSNIFFTQSSMEFEIEDHVQPYITSRDAGIANTDIEFSGLSSNLPEYFIEKYTWDFGDGEFHTGPEIRHQYKKPGVYGVKLGLTVTAEGDDYKKTRCVVKTVTVVPDNQAMVMYLSGLESTTFAEAGSMKRDTGEIKQDFSVFDIDPEEEVFRVEVLSSDRRIKLDHPFFDPLREDYELKEFYISSDSSYSYTVGEYESLLATYGIFNDVVDKGYATACVKTYVLAELPSEVITKINKDFAEFADANFGFSQSDVSEDSYPILDRISKIMEENPDLVLEIAAHTDNVGSFDFNLELSQKRAKSILDYLVSKGIDKIRLEGNGYGESRPIATNGTEEGRKKNRRVEFIILNK